MSIFEIEYFYPGNASLLITPFPSLDVDLKRSQEDQSVAHPQADSFGAVSSPQLCVDP